ncbi:MAG TPA: hypothetical protein VL856_01010 [Acidimicrobiia bacterium]|jgi:hypothetical protein|nr:hypothetical protein [Acidimicrobiia bacterium]
MADESRERARFPWWVASVLAAGLVIMALVAHRPTSAPAAPVARTRNTLVQPHRASAAKRAGTATTTATRQGRSPAKQARTATTTTTTTVRAQPTPTSVTVVASATPVPAPAASHVELPTTR